MAHTFTGKDPIWILYLLVFFTVKKHPRDERRRNIYRTYFFLTVLPRAEYETGKAVIASQPEGIYSCTERAQHLIRNATTARAFINEILHLRGTTQKKG